MSGTYVFNATDDRYDNDNDYARDENDDDNDANCYKADTAGNADTEYDDDNYDDDAKNAPNTHLSTHQGGVHSST